MKIVLPLDIWMPRKTMDDKRVHLNQNWYRNAHHMVSNKVKELFKAHVLEAVKDKDGNVLQLPKGGRYSFSYRIFPESNRALDVMNPGSVIDKFTCDALVELGVIKDDNHKILPEFTFSFGGIDKENPRCELEILAIE